MVSPIPSLCRRAHAAFASHAAHSGRVPSRQQYERARVAPHSEVCVVNGAVAWVDPQAAHDGGGQVSLVVRGALLSDVAEAWLQIETI